MRQLMSNHHPALTSVADVAPGGLWLFVLPGSDVYSNLLGELSPAWRLGNLRRDGPAAIVDALQNERPPGLQAMFRVPVSDLARRFGRPYGRRVYTADDLKERWARMWANAAYSAEPGGMSPQAQRGLPACGGNLGSGETCRQHVEGQEP